MNTTHKLIVRSNNTVLQHAGMQYAIIIFKKSNKIYVVSSTRR